MNKAYFILILLALIATACTKNIDLGDFDTQRWKDDPKGCKGERALMIDDLIEVKSKLLGLYQKKIIRALGQPEEQELFKRSQTYYIYHIDPSETCDSASENPRVLEVRFTSLGIANEVNIK